MSDLPLIAAAEHAIHDGGWSARLAPDERIPDVQKYLDSGDCAWIISPGLFACYVTTNRSDPDLRYAQVMWSVAALARKEMLVLGPSEDGLWPVEFPDGSIGYGFVLTAVVPSTLDLHRAATALRYDDSVFGEFTFPRADGMKRHIPRGYDQWGRKRVGLAEYLG
jgi:hypothetical protein